MRKEIIVDGRKVAFEANALTPRLYRYKYGRDIIRDLNALKQHTPRRWPHMPKASPGEDASPEEVARYQEELQERLSCPPRIWRYLRMWLTSWPSRATQPRQTARRPGWKTSTSLAFMRCCRPSWSCGRLTRSRPQNQKKNKAHRPRGNRGDLYAPLRGAEPV